jgi:hypothetical protein
LFPTPFTVEHSSQVVTGENALGQAVAEFVTQTRAVYGWSTKSATDGSGADMAGRVTTEVSLLTPDSDWRDGDLVTLPLLGQFTVRGGVHDMSTGPFGFSPGYKVSLRKVQDGPA